MTPATAEAPAAPPTPTPVEWVKSLPVEAREAVLIELLKELVAANGNAGCIDIETENVEYMGYFVPAEAERLAAERLIPKLSPERERELRDRMTRLHEAVPIRELIGKPIGTVAPIQSP